MILSLNKFVLVVFLLSLFSIDTAGQTTKTKNNLLTDTTIFLDELVFNSAQEEELFRAVYLDDSKDYFSLIYLAKKGVKAEKLDKARLKLDNKVKSFKDKNVLAKGEKKSIKYIYKEVHKEFFTKYERINHFDDVFTSGYFNCLSASFLYSLIMEELEIPYQINILPDHVNLTTYPKTHKILLETTDPVKGYFSFDKKFRESYVSSLMAYKIIEKSDLINSSVDDLFQKHYYSNEVVNLKQLVGAQYFNDGLYLMDKENYNEAIEQLEKSIALYPSVKAARVLVTLYSSEIGESKYTKKQHLDYLLRVLRYKETGVDERSVKFEFKKITDYHLIDKTDTVYFKEVYELLKENLTNDSIKTELKEFYYGSLGDYYRKQLKYEKAANNYLEVVLLGNDGERIKSLYASAIIYHVEGFSNKKKSLEYLIEAERKYDKIITDRLYISYKAELYCLLMMRSFDKNDPKNGEMYMLKMESIYENNDVKINENNVGIAYAQAGSYYFRKGARSKAKMLLKKGLEYAPGNYELETRLKMISY